MAFHYYTIQCSYCDTEEVVEVDGFGGWSEYPSGWEYDYSTDEGDEWTCPDCLSIFNEDANIKRVKMEETAYLEGVEDA